MTWPRSRHEHAASISRGHPEPPLGLSARKRTMGARSTRSPACPAARACWNRPGGAGDRCDSLEVPWGSGSRRRLPVSAALGRSASSPWRSRAGSGEGGEARFYKAIVPGPMELSGSQRTVSLPSRALRCEMWWQVSPRHRLSRPGWPTGPLCSLLGDPQVSAP